MGTSEKGNEEKERGREDQRKGGNRFYGEVGGIFRLFSRGYIVYRGRMFIKLKIMMIALGDFYGILCFYFCNIFFIRRNRAIKFLENILYRIINIDYRNDNHKINMQNFRLNSVIIITCPIINIHITKKLTFF